MFKLAILLFCCSIISKSLGGIMDELTEDQKQMIKNLHDACVSETGVTQDLIDGANKGNFPQVDSLKCYMKCIVTSVGIMEDDGTFDFDTYIGMLPDSYRSFGEKVAANCKGEIDSNPCESAYKIHVCTYKTDPANFILY